MRARVWVAALGVALVQLVALSAAAQSAGGQGRPSLAEGEALYKQRCASCHDAPADRTPSKADLGQRWGDEIARALTDGVMQPMATGLSPSQISSIAIYLTGGGASARPPGQVDPPKCAAAKAFNPAGQNWNGWGTDERNHRYQTNGGLKAADVPKLQVKWAFTYIGARYSQPVVMGGWLFMTSASGRIYAFDAKSGCYHWQFNAPAGVRTTPLIAPSKAAESGYALYFGDYQRNAYALDAGTGAQLWKTNVEPHPRAVLTGSPVLVEDKLIFPVSGWEEVTAGAAPYQCCTARGSVVSVNAVTGKVNWKTHAIEQAPQPTRKNAAGTQLWGPAGAAIWSTPTIDKKRRLIYATTGNSYTEVPEGGSNAVMAIDLDTGKVRWRNQVRPGDNYLSGCSTTPKAINCPLGDNGPDYDFGSSALLITLPSGKDILVAGQKSGTVYGMDPDKGTVVWKTQLGAGSALGGVEFGMATDGKTVFVANADMVTDAPSKRPGLFAVDPATGKELWYAPTPKVACGWTGGSRCYNSNSAAPIAIPGAVIAGSTDGWLRAYDPKDGKVLWAMDTAGRSYDTINGVKGQHGGVIDAGGAIVAEGMVFVMSGYVANVGGVPDNVLLALSVDGK